MKDLDVDGQKILKLMLKIRCALDLSCAVGEEVVGYDEHNNGLSDSIEGAGYFVYEEDYEFPNEDSDPGKQLVVSTCQKYVHPLAVAELTENISEYELANGA